MIYADIKDTEENVVYSEEESLEDEEGRFVDSLLRIRRKWSVRDRRLCLMSEGLLLTTRATNSAIPLSPNSSSKSGTSSKNNIGISCLASKCIGIPGCEAGAGSKARFDEGRVSEDDEWKDRVPGWSVV